MESDTPCTSHRKKRFTRFPSPAGMSLTKLPLGRNNSVMTSLFPPKESLVVTSRLGTGNSRTFFLRCSHLIKLLFSTSTIAYISPVIHPSWVIIEWILTYFSSCCQPMVHRKKRFTSFPSPAGMSLTKLPLGRNNSDMTSLFPPRESLAVTSRLGTGNSRTFFLRCIDGCWWLYSVFLLCNVANQVNAGLLKKK
jgi:hypothetical protein